MRETCIFQVLAHHRCPTLKAWWWWAGEEGGVCENGGSVSNTCVRRLKWTVALYQSGSGQAHAGHPGLPFVACHCHLYWSVNGQFWPDLVCGAVAARSVPGQARGRGVENLEVKTCDSKGDAVVLLPCPSRFRTDVQSAVVDGLLTDSVVWQWWA